MAGNMESLLLGDDSSSGESDTEPVNVNVGAAGSTTASAAAAVAAQRAAAVQPTAAAAAAAPTLPPPATNSTSRSTSGGMTQSEMALRLKSMYSPANKSSSSSSNNKPSVQPPMQQLQLPPAQQQQQQPSRQIARAPHPQQQQQQRSQPPSMMQHQQHHPSQHPSQMNHGQYRPTSSSSTAHRGMPSSSAGVSGSTGSSSSSSRGMSGMTMASSSQPIPVAGSRRQSDPFEPTPVQAIIDRHQQKAARAQQASSHRSYVQSQQQQQSNVSAIMSQSSSNSQATVGTSNVNKSIVGMGVSAGGTSSSTSSKPQDRAALEREMKKQKERFLIFTRVLIKYLEQKDPELHIKVKQIIKDCAERNKRQERGYESVTASMRSRLKAVVSENYWKRAEAYLHHFLQQKAKQSGGTSSSSVGAGSTGGTSLGSSSASLMTAGSSGSSADMKMAQDAAARKKAADMDRMRQMQAQRSSQLQQQQQQASSSSRSSASTSAVDKQRLGRAGITSASSAGGPQQQQQQQKQAPQSSTSVPAPSSSSTSAYNKSAAISAAAASKGGGKGKTARASGKTASPAAQKRAAAAASLTSLPPSSEQQQPKPQHSLKQPEPPREYSEFVEMVDHAVHFDWTATAYLTGQQMHTQMDQEQKSLLYYSSTDEQQAKSAATTTSTTQPQFPLPGWDRRNVISSRVAWARLRLPENKARSSNRTTPVVGNGLLSLPPVPGRSTSSTAEAGAASATAWQNEEVTEGDLALAALSEGAQIYLKSVLEKALYCARQRQNLDGIRLWHQQVVARSRNSIINNAPRPPLSLRLGCDVERQVARAAGNAALTCKRMEQALERQTHVADADRTLSQDVLCKATSMSDLSLRPKLANGVEKADYEAKRSFEIFGGKNANEPVLGRVPKQAKLELRDFAVGMQMGAMGRRAQRAATLSGSFAF